MNKLFSLATVALVSVAAYAQEIDFKVDYKENTTYTQTLVTDMNMVISHPAEGTFEQPMNSTNTYVITTGKKAAGNVPFTGSLKMENDMMPDATQTTNAITGNINNGTITVETFTIEGAEQEAVTSLKEAFANAFSQFKNQKIKVGQSFILDKLPSSLGGGMNIDTGKLAMTYTLKKIEGNKAIFDVLLKETTLDINTQGITMNCTISITGTMTYLTDKQYVSGQELTTVSKFITSEDIGINMDMNGKTVMTTTATAN